VGTGGHLNYWLPRPASHYRKNGVLTASAPLRPCSKPDLDNLAKATMDAMNATGVWTDDARVCELVVRKDYAPADGFIGLIVVLEVSQ
jgi:Holliday junction resolvase RusA-like endonuclease